MALISIFSVTVLLVFLLMGFFLDLDGRSALRSESKSQLVIFGSESVQDVWGVFDDNSQNNIMSDIDKHHGDSYSCPGASVHKNFSIGIIIEGSWTNPNFDTWWANTNW